MTASTRELAAGPVTSACNAPFVSMYFTTSGNVLACCRNETFVLGNVTRERLADIWSGERVRTLRTRLADFKFDLGCAFCDWERTGGVGTPLFSLYKHFPVESNAPEWPAVIDFVASNTCNFACEMCWGELSSSIRAKRQGLPALPRIYGDAFFEDLRPFLRHLRWMNFLGGEPFLAAECFRVWDMIVADDLPVACHVTTNGSQLTPRVKRVLDLIPMSLTVSLDGATKNTFEAVRQGGHFETVVANIQHFSAYARERGTTFKLAFCLMRQNWHEFADVLAFGDRLGCDVVVNTVIDPSHCSLFTLPTAELHAVVEALDGRGRSDVERLERNRTAWTNAIEGLRAATLVPGRMQVTHVLQANARRDDPIAIASRLAEQGALAAAADVLRLVGNSDPNRYFALSLLGRVLAESGDLAGAQTALDTALGISRRLPGAFLGHARVHLIRRDDPAALEAVEQAQAATTPENAGDAEALALLCIIHVSQLRLFAAAGALRRWKRLPAHCRAAEGVSAYLEGLTTARARQLRRRLRLVERIISITDSVRQARVPQPPGLSTQGSGPHAVRLPETVVVPQSRWSLHASTGRAHLSFRGDRWARVAIDAVGSQPWSVQLNFRIAPLTKDRHYVLSFKARSDASRPISVGVAKAVAPWTNCGLYQSCTVGPEWTAFRLPFRCAADEPICRAHFDLGADTAAVEFDDVVLGSSDAEVSR